MPHLRNCPVSASHKAYTTLVPVSLGLAGGADCCAASCRLAGLPGSSWQVPGESCPGAGLGAGLGACQPEPGVWLGSPGAGGSLLTGGGGGPCDPCGATGGVRGEGVGPAGT